MGAFTGDYANPEKPEGARLVALPMEVGVPLAELTDDVRQDGALRDFRVKVLGLPVTTRAYVDVLEILGAAGYRDQTLGTHSIDYGPGHFTCFQFGYDWRRDIRETAAELYRYLQDKRQYVAAETGRDPAEVKFDVVAHSMGGLVTRYMLRYGDDASPTPELTWKGAELVGRVMVVGTPNAGSVESLRQLVEGKRFGPWFLPEAPAAVLGTIPSIYQLLPRPRHDKVVDGGAAVDLFDPAAWASRGWGLAGNADGLDLLLPTKSDSDRRRVAADHLAKCLLAAEQTAAALDSPADLPPGLELHLFAGDAAETAKVLRWDGEDLQTVETAAGDGTVLRSSAMLDERIGGTWGPRLVTPIDYTGVNFLFQNHIGITKSPEFVDKVMYLLLEAPRPDEAADEPRPSS